MGFNILDPVGLFDGPGPNPADAAQKYLDQIPDMEKGYYNPFIDRGAAAGEAMSPVLDQMTQDPTGYINSLMSQYSESPGAKLRRDEALRAAGNTAAAGGMTGTISNIARQASLSDRLMQQDMQPFLQNVLGAQQQGLAGEQNLYGTGYDASKTLAGDLSNVLGQKAQYAFQGQRELNQRKSDKLKNILKLAGTAAGFAFGGPAGGMLVGGALGAAGGGGGSSSGFM